MQEVMPALQGGLEQVVGAIPAILNALLLLILAWVVAIVVKVIFQKGLTKAGVPALLVKSKIAKTKESGGNILKSLGKALYYLVFLLFLPSILDALNMTSVAEPISNMISTFLNFLPNLIGAAFIFVIGFFVARLVRDLARNFLESLQVDKLFASSDTKQPGTEKGVRETRFGSTTSGTSTTDISISSILANVVFALILIPIAIVALETLNIQSITVPATDVLNTVLNMIPNIFVAIALVAIGYFLAKFVSNLLTDLLKRAGISSLFRQMGISESQQPSFDLAEAIGKIVHVLIILFFTVEALNVLQLEVLNQFGTAIIAYLPLALSSIIIIGIGLLAATWISNLIVRYSGQQLTATIAKYAIILFAVFMTLSQLGFAPTIVNIGFLLILGAFSIAFAISFGIGGRAFAARTLERFEEKMKKDKE